MKTKKVILQPAQDTTPVTFCDVAAYFSEEEWSLLYQWQKEVYSNVMKEIHHAFNSLGPLIATSVFSLRPKEKEKLNSMDLQNFEIRDIIYPSSRDCDLSSSNVLRVYETLDSDLMEEYEQVGESSTGTHLGDIDVVPVVSCKIKREEDHYSTQHHGSMKNEILTSSTGVREGSCRQKRDDRAQDHPAPSIHSMVSGSPQRVFVRQRGGAVGTSEAYFHGAQHQSGLGQATGLPFHDLEEAGDLRSYQSTEGTVTDLNSGPEVTTTVTSVGINQEGVIYAINIQDCPKRESFNSAGGNRRMIRKKTLGNCLISRDQSTLRKSSAKKVKSESPEMQQICLKSSNIAYQRADAVKGGYSCRGCGKSFSAMSNLIRHERIHTGERPYQCAVCGKSFNQKEALLRHQRMHTGERPYHCTICGKRFNQKHHLIAHQKTHAKTDPKSQH
ncbi:zinc finger protein 398-like isoform X2 [Ambystoma mexicanum]|uniref:zinc finger protein 398-like isoform X2 n=1 Tax=Ambystoma mexicanum TaxID=8296 RepID=UPI0037E7066E